VAALVAAAAGATAWLTVGQLLQHYPGVPERMPAPLPDWLARLSPEPDWRAVPVGPVLAGASRRGELAVGVRAYARPAPSDRPTPPEADAFDVEFARYLAGRLHVRLRVVALQPDARGDVAAHVPGVDLVIAGASEPSASVPTAYTGGPGRLVALRGSALHTQADLAGKPVCVASGSPYANGLAAAGAVPHVYESAIRAVSAFMSGACDALAEDDAVLDRLLGLPEWRFYRRLDTTLLPGQGSRITLREADTASAAWVDLAARHWKTGGAFAAARERRAAAVGYEAGLLQGGFVCHS